MIRKMPVRSATSSKASIKFKISKKRKEISFGIISTTAFFVFFVNSVDINLLLKQSRKNNSDKTYRKDASPVLKSEKRFKLVDTPVYSLEGKVPDLHTTTCNCPNRCKQCGMGSSNEQSGNISCYKTFHF